MARLMAGLMFGVDLGELRATVEALGGCDEELAEVLGDVASRVAALHGSWAGRAAAAQALAQAEWEAGFAGMRAGLARMRSAADAAHGRYDDAARTNLRMWEQVS